MFALMSFFEIWRDFMYGNGHVYVYWRVASCFSINIRDVECKKPGVATFSMSTIDVSRGFVDDGSLVNKGRGFVDEAPLVDKARASLAKVASLTKLELR